MGKSYVTKKNLFKFLLGSAFGILMFLVPIPQGESFTTLLDFLKSWIKGLFGGNLSYIIMVMLVFSAVVSVYDFIAKPDWIRKNHYLSRAFSTTPLYLGSKILGAVFAVMIVFKIGPEMIISADTGATMIDLCGTLFSIVLAFSFILPFLTDCGIMEFLGVIAKPVVRPLFHVPGRASVDLIASWFGASNAAVILTREQYMKGFYTKREAGYIMTNFSLVSIPFCLMVADTMGIANLFPPFYLCICIVGIILAVIIARIPPIKTIPNTYRKSVGKQINEEIPQEKGIFAHAVEMSCKRAESFNAKTVGTSGLEVLMGMFFDLIPIVIAWGTIALVIATYTPVFNWMKGTKTFKPLVDKLESKAMRQKDQIEKYEFWGLVLFVGIPLPGTGAWTGSLIAALLGMKFKKAFPAVIIGICMATVIMWFISYVLLGGVHLLG